MRNFLILPIFLVFAFSAFSQSNTLKKYSSTPTKSGYGLKKNALAKKITGQWRGYFDESGMNIGMYGSNNTEYVLELDIDGDIVSGYSYSYFQNRRYYVICSLSGSYNKSSNSIKITETARIKGSTPPDWNDCLQTHILVYVKDGTTEELVGNWKSAPGQTSSCGSGTTLLTRKTLSKNITASAKVKPSKENSSASLNSNKKNNTDSKAKNNLQEKATSVKPIPDITSTIPKEKDVANKPSAIEEIKPVIKTPEEIDMVKRNNTILKTIEIYNKTFKVDLYDDGEIDGDSVSLFYNGKLLLSHQRLSDKPISLTLEVSDGIQVNELIMYAENLGTFPPNTALMIVTDADNRYEVRIASDMQKSGTIRFVKGSKKE